MEALLLTLAIYFIPSIVAMVNDHKNVAGIIILNLLTGWTGIGWVGALIWAVVNAKQPEVVVHVVYKDQQEK